MAIYKCAPQSVVESSAAKDARLLSVSRQNLDEQAFFLFSGTPETSSILVNTELAGLSVYDWYSRQDEKTLGKKSRPYLYVPFEIEKISAPQDGSVIINNEENEAIVYTMEAPAEQVIYFNKTEALSLPGDHAGFEPASLQNDFLAWPTKPGSVFAFNPGLTLVLTAPAFVLMFSSLLKGDGTQPKIADAGKTLYVKDGQAKNSLIGYTSVFEIDKCELDGSIVLSTTDESYQILLLIGGEAVISQKDEVIHAQAGTAVLIPANEENVVVTGNAQFVSLQLL